LRAGRHKDSKREWEQVTLWKARGQNAEQKIIRAGKQKERERE